MSFIKIPPFPYRSVNWMRCYVSERHRGHLTRSSEAGVDLFSFHLEECRGKRDRLQARGSEHTGVKSEQGECLAHFQTTYSRVAERHHTGRWHHIALVAQSAATQGVFHFRWTLGDNLEPGVHSPKGRVQSIKPGRHGWKWSAQEIRLHSRRF